MRDPAAIGNGLHPRNGLQVVGRQPQVRSQLLISGVARWWDSSGRGSPRQRGCLTRGAAIEAVAVIGLSVVLCFVAPQPVRGCSCSYPPHWGFISPENGRLPANAVGVLWFKPKEFDRRYRLQQPPSEREVATRITVEKRVRDRFERVPGIALRVDGFDGVFVVGPREGLAVGATYRFTDPGPLLDDEYRDWADEVRPLGSGPHRKVRVTVDAARLSANSPLTIEAGTTTPVPIAVASGGGACAVFGEPIPHVTIQTGLVPEVERWRGQLLFRTLVDEEAWAGAESLCSLYPSGRSWRQVGQDTIYSTCREPGARGEAPIAFRTPQGAFRELAALGHTVRMQAILPGSGILLESEALTVDLSCPEHARDTWVDAAWFGLRAPDSPCSCPAVRVSGFVGPAEARLPGNAAGVVWYDSRYSSGLRQQQPDPTEVLSSRLSVRVLSGGQDWEAPVPTVVRAVQDFPGAFVVAPEGGFVAGARYFFVDGEHGDRWWRHGDSPWDLRKGVIATVDSVDLLPATTRLSLSSTPSVFETLRVARPFRCDTVERLPQVHVEARLDGVGPRWREQLLYRTLVDGAPWHGVSTECAGVQLWPGIWAASGNDLLYGRCPDGGRWNHGLEPGPHQVQMKAFLPGTPVVFTTETVTVDLSCLAPVEE